MKIKPGSGKKLFVVAAIAAVLVFISVSFYNLYIDYSMANELGSKYVSVFLINTKYKVIIRIISFLFVFFASFVSFRTVKRNLVKNDEENAYSFLNSKYIILIPSIVIALFISNIVKLAVYDSLLTFLNPVFVGMGDPLFFKDIGYYLFQRPFLKDLFASLFYIVLFISVTVLVSYIFLCGRLGIEKGKKLISSKGIFLHNLADVSILILIKTISYIFTKEDILFSTGGIFFGADYSDHHVVGMYYNIIPWLLIAVVVATTYFVRRNKTKYAAVSFALYPAAYLLLLISMFFVNTFVVKPQEAAMQKKYIANNIHYTSGAYNLNEVEKKEFAVQYMQKIENAGDFAGGLSGLRITDLNYSLKGVNQLQEIKNFYRFNDIDVARYDIDGKPSAVAIAAREINSNILQSTNQTYFNKNLKYTHGYGIAAIRLNSVTKEGQPEFVAKDIPVVFAGNFKKIRQPRIYFGEMSGGYAVVNSGYSEFDYPENNTEKTFYYTGKSGISMNLLNKLVYSVHYNDFQLLVSGMVNSNSKLIINRNVVKRVETAAPFLVVDKDPYLLIDNSGKLKWIVDCYTVSENYPYSTPTKINGKNVNYIRNSVKATVDAYDGTVEFYITDKNDIIAACYNKIYPGFFNKNGLPADLSEHIVYPETLFKIQAEMLKKYHISDPDVFYNNSSLWDISKEKVQNEMKNVEPYYSMVPTESGEEKLMLIQPFSTAGKDDMSGMLFADNTTGKLTLYTFAGGKKPYGIMQIENRIDNDTGISGELSLISGSGSTVIRGNLLALPVKDSVIYIEPVYIASDDKAEFPELKKIIMSYGEKIVMADNYVEVLRRLFSAEIQSPDHGETVFEPGLSENGYETLIELFDNVKKNLNEGDWEGFGTSFSQLEDEINRLREKTEEKEETEESEESEEGESIPEKE